MTAYDIAEWDPKLIRIYEAGRYKFLHADDPQTARRVLAALTGEQARTEKDDPRKRVRLLKFDSYLSDNHGVLPGAIGRMVQASRLSRDDNGWLIDFGDGAPVRCDPDEYEVIE